MDTNYTPIKDKVTGKPIRLGDAVQNEKGQCGILIWDDYYNRYMIRSETGGNLYSNSYVLIDELHPNKIDTSRIECRRQPNKVMW